jgi:putative sterol carrier protein
MARNALGALALLLVASHVSSARAHETASASLETPASTQARQEPPKRRTLTEIGAVVARKETWVMSPFEGEVIWKIDEGLSVKPGDEVVRFDPTRVEEALEQDEEDLADHQEAVRQREIDLDLARKRAELEIKRAETELAKARLDEETQTVKGAELKYGQAKKDFEAHEALFKLGYVSDSVYKQKRLDKVQAEVEWAKQKLLDEILKQGATKQTLQQTRLRVQQQELNLEAVTRRVEADAKIAEARVDLARIQLQNRERIIRRRKLDLERTVVRAPVAGRVAYMDVWKGSRDSMSPIQVGESHARGQSLCRILDNSTPQLKVLINQVDLAYRLAADHAGEAFNQVVEVFLDLEELDAGEAAKLRVGFTGLVSIELQPGAP